MVLGQLPPRKIAPPPNPKPKPDFSPGQLSGCLPTLKLTLNLTKTPTLTGGAIFLTGAIVRIPWKIYGQIIHIKKLEIFLNFSNLKNVNSFSESKSKLYNHYAWHHRLRSTFGKFFVWIFKIWFSCHCKTWSYVEMIKLRSRCCKTNVTKKEAKEKLTRFLFFSTHAMKGI